MQALNSVTLQSPGTLGLNTQSKDDVIDPREAIVLDNCIFDRNGRLAARKGYTRLNGTAASGTPTLDVVHSYINASGSEIIVSAGGSKLWTGTTSLTDNTGSVTVTGDNWQFQNVSGNCVGCQASHEPVYYIGSGNFGYLVDQLTQWAATTAYSLENLRRPLAARNGYYYEVTTAGTSGGTEPTWPTTVGNTVVDGTVTWTCRQIPKSDAVLSAWGRLWMFSGTTVYYSDLLIPYAFSGGSSGTLNLQSVWTTGADTIISIAAHNNNLIIFCKNSIVIYGSADNVSNIALADVINGIGCLARDSVQNIGTDILFLSSGGVRSLGRTVLQNTLPISEISYSVREDLADDLSGETVAIIRSTYNERNGFYLLGMPTSMRVWCFDLTAMSQGKTRITTWTQMSPYSFCTRLNQDLIFGFSGGFLGKYGSYYDYTSAYTMSYKSGWIDFGLKASKAIWKKAAWYVLSNADREFTSGWAFDFDSETRSVQKIVDGGITAQYGVSQFGLSSFGFGDTKDKIDFPMSGVGSIVQLSMSVSIQGADVGFNKIDLFYKNGRVI